MSASVARKSPMGLHSSRRPISSDRDRSSPPRRRERSPIVSSRHSRGPPHEERSPARHKSSYRDRDGPVPATRERHYGRVKSPKRESRSPISRSLSPRSEKLRRAQAEKDVDSASESDHERNHGKGSNKPKHEKSYTDREKLYRDRDEPAPAPRERYSGRVKSPKRESRSPVSRSLSPRSKRLRRAQAEKEFDTASGRDHERNHGKGSDKAKHEKSYMDRDSEKEVPKERREWRSERESERTRDSDRERTRDKEIEKGRDRDAMDRSSSRSKHRRSESPSDRLHNRSRHRSRSPPQALRSRVPVEADDPRGAEHGDDESDALAQMKAAEQALETKEKQKPSFELSGKLAEETNRVRGITLLFTEPPDARKPDVRWRLYVFKGGEVLNEPLYVHRQSCYLFGRERRVADIPTDHPSCSKQHAVLQYRQVEIERPDGMMSKQIKPYLMDLGSTNKTFINDSPIEPQRYYELFEKDTIKFGNSSREYVLLHENSMN